MSQCLDDGEEPEKAALLFSDKMRTETLALVQQYERAGMRLSNACELAGVSRAWVYKWRARDRPEESWADRREISQGDRDWIDALLAEGKTQTEVAAQVKVSRATVRKVARQRKAHLELNQLRGNNVASTAEGGTLQLQSMSTSDSFPDNTPDDSNQGRSAAEKAIPSDDLTPQHTALVGPAGELMKTFRFADGPIIVLFHGPPGVGKSALCTHLASHLVAPEHIERIIGPNCTVDKLRDLMSTFLTRPLFGDWHVMILEEADKIPSVAQVSILELLDRLPKYCAIFATTNEGESKFTKRLWTRFERHPVGPPSHEEVASLISETVPRKQRETIAAAVNGNARDALLKAQAWARLNLTAPGK